MESTNVNLVAILPRNRSAKVNLKIFLIILFFMPKYNSPSTETIALALSFLFDVDKDSEEQPSVIIYALSA
ncbi:hypothetical protein S83_048424 [Arachis hypogaea]